VRTWEPKKQKDATRIGPGLVTSLSVVPPRFRHEFPSRTTDSKEFQMKRILVALVLALSVATVVGCGSSTTTGTGKK
jgi:hypothetical protein